MGRLRQVCPGGARRRGGWGRGSGALHPKDRPAMDGSTRGCAFCSLQVREVCLKPPASSPGTSPRLSLRRPSLLPLSTGFVQLVTPTKRVCVRGLGVLCSLCLRSPARPAATSSSFDPSSPESKETCPRLNPLGHAPSLPEHAPLDPLLLCPQVPFPDCKLLTGRDLPLRIPRGGTVFWHTLGARQIPADWLTHEIRPGE